VLIEDETADQASSGAGSGSKPRIPADRPGDSADACE
jgi:hypothetical protein